MPPLFKNKGPPTKGLQQTNPKQIQFSYNSTNSPINHRLLTSTQPDRNQIKVKKNRLPVTSIDKFSKHTTHQHKLFIIVLFMYFLQLYLMNSIITLLWAPVVKNDRNMELNTTILSKNERVCSLSKSQEYNLTLKCNKIL